MRETFNIYKCVGNRTTLIIRHCDFLTAVHYAQAYGETVYIIHSNGGDTYKTNTPRWLETQTTVIRPVGGNLLLGVPPLHTPLTLTTLT